MVRILLKGLRALYSGRWKPMQMPYNRADE